VWIGTVDEIASKLHDIQGALGVSRYVIRPEAMVEAQLVIEALGLT
jgi:hypothetical protein